MATGDLTTLAKFKAWAGVTANSDDALIADAVTAVSEAVKSYISRDILQASYVETRNGHGGPVMISRQNPITAVASLSVDGSDIPFATGYKFDNRRVYMLNGRVFTRDVQNVVITYTAGYATVPTDIQQALHEWLSIIYKERERVGYSSKTLGGESVAFDIKEMPKRVTLYLEPWIRVVPTR